MKYKPVVTDFLRTNKVYVYALFFICAGIDVLYYAFVSDFLFFPTIILFLWMVIFYQLKSADTLKITVGFLFLLLAFFIMDKQTFHTDRVTTWIFFLLFISLGQQVLELRHKK